MNKLTNDSSFRFKVWMEVLSGGVRSNDNIYVHFIGILLHADSALE